ncbi:MAG: acetate--CoA ligase family protein [Acidobacteria bacterium]|nr:acetate--CoA ligase family protein [Acidobacteriota bacterium]
MQPTATRPPSESLDALLRPASVAVIGASNDPTRIGGRPIRYLRAAGYAGRVYPVNPRHTDVQGLAAFPHISDVPEAVDLAIVAVPAPSVVDTIEACAARGVQVAVIYSAGFAEMGAEGRRQQRRLRETAAETGLRIVGPNCLGVYNSETGFFATFSTTLEDGFPAPGGVALVSQSGAYGSHLSLLARKRNIDIRYWVTTGNEADVSVSEVLGWLAQQDEVDVIMAHAEGITDRDALVHALETARARRKPVVFQKVGVTEVGAEAARSHTASLAGADPVYEAAFRQFGAYRARDTDEMLDIAYAASFGIFPESPRVALVSISGGVGVQMADAAVGFGLDVAPLSESAQTRLKAALPYASPRNPVDITAQAFNRVELISDNLGIVFEEEQHDAVVAFFTYVAAADGMVEPIRDAIHAARERRPGCALVLSIVAPPDVVRQYEAVGCPVFEDPTRAVRSVAALHRFSRIFAEGSEEVRSERASGASDPTTIPPRTPSLPEGPISEREAKRLLSEAGVPVVEETLARSAGEAARAAAAFGSPVAVKLCAPGILHKTELGGVVLDVSNGAEARQAYETTTSRARAADPAVRIEGVLIAPMVTGGVETILGVRHDPTFGPVVMFGLGGTLVEVIEDVSFRVAPFSEAEAHRMIEETRAARVLRGTRGRGPYDMAALAAALSRLSFFAAEHGDRIETAEINPFVVLPEGHGAVALDAVIVPCISERIT